MGITKKDTVLILDDDCSCHEVIQDVYTRKLKDDGIRVLFPRFTDPGGDEEDEHCDSFYLNKKKLTDVIAMLQTQRERIGLLILDTSMPGIKIERDFASLNLNRLPFWLWSIMDYDKNTQLSLMELYAEKGFVNFENFIEKTQMLDIGLDLIRERFKKIN